MENLTCKIKFLVCHVALVLKNVHVGFIHIWGQGNEKTAYN